MYVASNCAHFLVFNFSYCTVMYSMLLLWNSCSGDRMARKNLEWSAGGDLTGSIHILGVLMVIKHHLHHQLLQQNPGWLDILPEPAYAGCSTNWPLKRVLFFCCCILYCSVYCLRHSFTSFTFSTAFRGTFVARNYYDHRKYDCKPASKCKSRRAP